MNDNERPTPIVDADDRPYPSPDYCQRIRFEGNDCVVMAPEEYDALYEKARDLERSLAAVTSERDALKHALIELEAAAEAYAADQSRATDSRCGLVQPITVMDGNRLLSALKIANELTK